MDSKQEFIHLLPVSRQSQKIYPQSVILSPRLHDSPHYS